MRKKPGEEEGHGERKENRMGGEVPGNFFRSSCTGKKGTISEERRLRRRKKGNGGREKKEGGEG